MRSLLVAGLLTLSFASFGQSFAEWENVVDEYCRDFYASCFGGDFVGITAVNDVDFMTESHVIIKGELEEQSTEGMAQQCSFKADVHFFRDHIMLNLQKCLDPEQQDAPWDACENRLSQ